MRDSPSADAYSESNNGIYAILRKTMQLGYNHPHISTLPSLLLWLFSLHNFRPLQDITIDNFLKPRIFGSPCVPL